jgi:cell division protein FtsA
MFDNYICSLDIGSSKIAATLARLKKGKVNALFFESMPAKGIRKGTAVDSIELVNSIGRVLKNLKATSGVKIKFVYANVSGEDIVIKHSKAVIPLAERGNKVITLSDISRVKEQARILASSLEEEILHQMPVNFGIDSAENVTNPLGLYSHKLEVDLYLVSSRQSCIQSLSRAINQAGYDVKKIFFSGLATSRAILSREFGEGLNLLCDIGSDITETLIFKDGILKDIDVLSIGGDDLTRALADEFKIPFELAEDVKRSYGMCGDTGHIKDDKEILVKKLNAYNPIKQKQVCDILNAKSKIIFDKIKSQVEKRVYCTQLNNFFICGRTVLLEGFIESFESTLGIPVKLARISDAQIIPFINNNSELTGHKYLTYLTSLGMVSEAIKGPKVQFIPATQPQGGLIRKGINRFKEVYQEYF